jgi:hypothetical protein
MFETEFPMQIEQHEPWTGGVAPLRHELARQTHLQRQRDKASLNAALAGGSMRSVVARLGAAKGALLLDLYRPRFLREQKKR